VLIVKLNPAPTAFMTRQRRNGFAGVTLRAVRLSRTGLQLQGTEGDSEQFKELDRELSRELGLRPWHPSIFEVTAGIDDEGEILASVSRDQRAHYRQVINLRRSLAR
jgi:hypothetical protein